MINLNQYRHVLALAEECHFARAAARVHLSQPAFSRSIQAIEAQLGLKLFERQPGDIRPTPAGVFLVERARRLLFEARCLERDLALYQDHQLGDVAFGMGPMPNVTLGPRVVAEVRQAFPRIRMRLEINNWALLLERLRLEQIEFFVAEVRDLPTDPALQVEPLMRQVGRFYVRAGHPLGPGEHRLAEVWPYGVGTTRLPEALKMVLARLGGGDALTQPALECDDPRLLHQIGLGTDTVIATTEWAVADLVAQGLLRALDLPELPLVYADMGIVRLRHRTPAPMALKVIELFQRFALAEPGSGG